MNPEEFRLLVVNTKPRLGEPGADNEVLMEIILTPQHVVRTLSWLQKKVDEYETRFGSKIHMPKGPQPTTQSSAPSGYV